MTTNPSAWWVTERIQKLGKDGPSHLVHSTTERRWDEQLSEI